MMHCNCTKSSIITFYLLVLLTLAGCSKTPQSHESSSSDAQMQSSTEMAKTQQVAPVLMSAQTNPLENSRPLVKTASVNFEVNNVYQSALQLEQLTAEFAGVVEQKDIRQQVEDEFSRTGFNGQQIIFSKIRPQATMVVRIPQAQTQRFMNSLPQLMLFLNEQRYQAQRYELRLLQEKLAQQAAATTGNTGKAALPSRLDQDIAFLTQQEVQDRLNYSTIQLGFTQPATVRQTQDIQLAVVARQHDSIGTRLWHSIQSGAMGFVDVMVAAMLLWPLWLILLTGAVLLWRYKKQRRRMIKPAATSHSAPDDPV